MNVCDYAGGDLTGARSWSKHVACFKVPIDWCYCHNLLLQYKLNAEMQKSEITN